MKISHGSHAHNLFLLKSSKKIVQYWLTNDDSPYDTNLFAPLPGLSLNVYNVHYNHPEREITSSKPTSINPG